MTCSERDRLIDKAMRTLTHIIETTQQLQVANRANDKETVARLDSELELTLGEKERAFGALNQHKHDHGC